MKWTKERPTKNGYYWAYAKGHWWELWIVEVSIGDESSFSYNASGYDCEPEIEPEHVTHWMGPLKEPSPPED